MIIDAFKSFGLPFDEGATTDGETGIYGPYRQSQRAEIYQTFVKSLVQRGMAYPCFCTEGGALRRARAAGEKTRKTSATTASTPYGATVRWRTSRQSSPRARRMLSVSARRAALSTRSATRISSRARWKSPRTIRTWLSQVRRHPDLPLCARCGRPSDGHDRRCPRRGVAGNAAGTPAAVPRDGLEGAEVRTPPS